MSEQPPPDWYVDPEDGTQYRYWDGAAWTDHRAPVPQPAASTRPTPPTIASAASTEPAVAPEPKPVKKKTPVVGCLILAGVVVAAVIVIAVVAAGGSGGSNSATYKAKVLNVRVVNPATVNVSVEVTQVGAGTGHPSCTINVSDPGGSYTGVDIFNAPILRGDGDSAEFNGNVTVTNQGAKYVTKATVDCS